MRPTSSLIAPLFASLASLLSACPDSPQCEGACTDSSDDPPGDTSGGPSSGGPPTPGDSDSTTAGPATTDEPASTTGPAPSTTAVTTDDGPSTTGPGVDTTESTTGEPPQDIGGQIGSCEIVDNIPPSPDCGDGVLQPGEFCFSQILHCGTHPWKEVLLSTMLPLHYDERDDVVIYWKTDPEPYMYGMNGNDQTTSLPLTWTFSSELRSFGGGADFDVDGAIDVVGLFDGPTDRVSVLWRAGDQLGVYTGETVFTADEIVMVAVTDWDADGRPDIVATTDPAPGPGQLVVLLGDGAGNFNATPGTVLPQISPDFALGALDDDGVADDFAYTNGLVFHRDGGSESELDIAIAPELARKFVEIADLDGDGLGDVVALADNTLHGTSELLVALQVDGFAVTRYPVHCGAVDFDVGDFDGDDIPDLATASTDGRITLRRNDGDGGFAHVATTAMGGPLDPVDRIHFGDFDGDGDRDLATTRNPAKTLEFKVNAP